LCLGYFQRVRNDDEPLPALALSYSGWGAAERAVWTSAELQPRLEFWKKHLGGHRRLWTAKEGPDTASGGPQRLVAHFPAELVAATRELVRKSGATLFSTLLSVFQVAFGQWAGVDDVLVGSPVANRSKQAVNETMGSFAGIVPIRGKVDPELTVTEMLRAVHEITIDCFGYAMPFVELARGLGDLGKPGHNPIFEVRFALQNHPVPDVKFPGLSAKLRMRSTGTARFHLACEITEDGEQFEVAWLFRPKLFPQAKVEALGRLFQTVLAAACAAPDSRVSTLTSKP
jgi:non-ribosomal peptide synthetase component F